MKISPPTVPVTVMMTPAAAAAATPCRPRMSTAAAAPAPGPAGSCPSPTTAMPINGSHQGSPSGAISVNEAKRGERRLHREDGKFGGDQCRHLRADLRGGPAQGADPRHDTELTVDHAAQHLHARRAIRRRAPPLPESGLRNRRSPRWVRAGGRALPSASPTRTPPARAGSLGGPAASPRGSGDEVRYGRGAHAYRSEVLGARFVPRALGKVGPWWIPSSWRCRPCAMHVATL